MRDINRLDKIYDTICNLHKEYFPDWRVMQLMMNFLGWHYAKYHTDGFYVEENEFINRLTEYCKELGPY